MEKIYTRRGDSGETSLSGGIRVAKDSPKIECNGNIDEANSTIGLLRVKLGENHPWQMNLYQIQKDLMQVMGHIARADYSVPYDASEELINGSQFQEEWMNQLELQMKNPSVNFLLPGGNEISALCHVVRTQVRRSERRLATVIREEPIEDYISAYMNRLSDLFFILSRAEMNKNNVDEEVWRSFRRN
ncbi:cob(I)yrinic acid a,c-diamide adenosyltransferase [Ancylomarina salipaludis]|uniref:Corrinoid adenosyltransferase n=1 Tax=Ancylomarina salipaludis TaxID=2501299 RepID=A0A4Q1JPY9_9BACT|nr:cob(I)yrinic acid a,c-diamide adenosyltransferase [Ancylomarina salipaludis]RXQ96804.1 cob(I)yrinic acid a,c-diamide adenosyltransferase [Ancylomarina salipaludis]